MENTPNESSDPFDAKPSQKASETVAWDWDLGIGPGPRSKKAKKSRKSKHVLNSGPFASEDPPLQWPSNLLGDTSWLDEDPFKIPEDLSAKVVMAKYAEPGSLDFSSNPLEPQLGPPGEFGTFASCNALRLLHHQELQRSTIPNANDKYPGRNTGSIQPRGGINASTSGELQIDPTSIWSQTVPTSDFLMTQFMSINEAETLKKQAEDDFKLEDWFDYDQYVQDTPEQVAEGMQETQSTKRNVKGHAHQTIRINDVFSINNGKRIKRD
ncbi:hypothetical protein Dda_0052 [Drechslerella dactyloides]|uniref:Uncharacterized protein n=1 Tax=Drechslerella dactyloides TaxID=74499 RepID=A0AAD6J413_DREDA|nr:hypothetical protein Dda_0052 [Drechslerella dactyloides]